jgi:hypothetical protein
VPGLGVSSFLETLAGRNRSETRVGCIVSLTIPTTSLVSAVQRRLVAELLGEGFNAVVRYE